MTTLAELIVQETKQALYTTALSVATAVGVPVTTWQPGDPTRSLYHVLSTTLHYLEQIAAKYVAGHFLDLAAQLSDTKWIKTLAYQQFGYTAREATYATCTVRLTNTGGGVYAIAAQDLVFAKTADPDITYRNTSGGTLLAGSIGTPTTLDVSVACDVAGSDGSAGIGAISLVTGLAGVTAANTTAAVGVDEESAASIVAGCRAKLESLSPNGAAGAYAYVALNATLTGASNVTRVAVLTNEESAAGEVEVYLASASGGASAPDVGLVDTAIAEYATPLTVSVNVASASAVPITVTPTVYVYDDVNATESEIEEAVATAVQNLFSSMPIGGDLGYVYRTRIISAIMQAYPGYVFHVTLAAPAGDTALDEDEVATTAILAADVTVSLEART